jgi:hypothetical protein
VGYLREPVPGWDAASRVVPPPLLSQSRLAVGEATDFGSLTGGDSRSSPTSPPDSPLIREVAAVIMTTP